MKKINIVAIIGENGSYGCPLHTNNQALDSYIKFLVSDGILVTNDKIHGQLPSKSPPFPGHEAYIISDDKSIVDPRLTRTKVLDSFSEVLARVEDSEKAVFILVDDILYEELLPGHFDSIDTIIVGQIDMRFENEKYFKPPSLFQWSALLLKEQKNAGKRSPGFTVHRYQKSDPTF